MADQYAPPPGPPPNRPPASSSAPPHVQWAAGSSELASNNPFRHAHVIPPQGPPPSSHPDTSSTYEPPPGPPPGHKQAPPTYQPPSGPPPSWSDDKKTAREDQYAPPPGPPPSHGRSSEAEPPPYDPWLAVPDNALLPPPPSLFEESSPSANASYDDAARAHAWCRQNPLWQPRPLNRNTFARIAAGDIRLTTPPNANKTISLYQPGLGRTHVRTSPACTDSIMLSDVPVYTASSPRPRTIYYELHVLSMGGAGTASEEADAGIALGFLAPPYPSWRLPGWHRASLGVHGDDGRRYIDNSYGGRDFVSMFRPDEVVGLGMAFDARAGCRVFFTRNGREEGGWDLHEERDGEQQEGDVSGLEGGHDLLAAIGCFGKAEFEVRFRREDWMFRPG